MLANYLIIAIRNLARNRLHTAINVTGLSLGIACVFIISLYLRHEIGYDRYYDHYENLYRITWEGVNPQTRTPHPMAQALVDDFPEVESAVSLSPLWAAGLTREIFSIRNIDKDLHFDEKGVLAVDTTFFDVFGFPVVRGDANRALRNVNGILISESMAAKYFGEDDPIGKHLAVNSDSTLLEVMAVFRDVPAQSHFHFDFLVSYVREKSLDPGDEYYTWADFGHFNYLRLRPGADPQELEGKLLPWIRKYINVSDEEFHNAIANNIGFRVQPVTDIHLKSHLRWELEANGNIEYVYIIAAAGLLTLLIACINFMNLMTARSAERAREIGIRKTLGALRRQLSFQFLSESLTITFISMLIAILIIEGILPFYNSLMGQAVDLDYRVALPSLFGLGLFVGIGSGLYPAVFLSAVTPYSILKGKAQETLMGGHLRNVLIVFQFTVSMALISGTAIIFNQLNYIRSKGLGFNQEEVLTIPLKNENLMTRIEAIKTELMRIDGIASVSAASNLPGGQFNQNTISLVENPNYEIDCSEAFVDYDFFTTLDIGLAGGRFFSPRDEEDTVASFVINETAARQLNSEQMVGKELHWHAYADDRPVVGRIVGVMKDFHYQSLHQPVRPLIFVLHPAYNHLVIKLDTEGLDTRLDKIRQVYSEFDTRFEFEYSFLDEQLNRQYQSEERTGIVFTAFAVIAIAIACFGLFGMAMLTFSQRTKEVSVRKVLGASVNGLIVLLLGDFTRLIVLAILMAIPLSWWLMDQWMNNFTYQVGIGPAVFVLSGFLLILVSWATLGYLTLKTSRINPAETLKAE
jgi:putative ABC transport system permease protein